MKKIFALLTGIVFTSTILVAGGCKPASNNDDPKDSKKVEISCKAVEKNGEIQFEMYDSNEPTKVVSDLTSDVAPGTKVIWMWVKDSEIQEFVKIGPKKPGKIITGNAKKISFTKKFMLKIPKKATKGTEKYDIVFLDGDGNTYPIDPYLRIR